MKNIPNSFIGASLRNLRNDKKLTQGELADRSSIGRPYLSLLENNRKSPKIGTVFSLAGGLEMKPSELVKAIEESIEGAGNQKN